jgi:hypothetical protein
MKASAALPSLPALHVLAPLRRLFGVLRHGFWHLHEAHRALADLEQYIDSDLRPHGFRRDEFPKAAQTAALLSLSGR